MSLFDKSFYKKLNKYRCYVQENNFLKKKLTTVSDSIFT